MNEYQRPMLGKPDCDSGICSVCGSGRANNMHHVIVGERKNPLNPRILLCGSGTTGCHGNAHERTLHFRWSDDVNWWQWLRSDEPMKYDQALKEKGWRRCL